MDLLGQYDTQAGGDQGIGNCKIFRQKA
jgi:hypothetical protein